MAVPGDDDDDFFFSPSNTRLVDHYLRAKVEGNLSDLAKAAYFVDLDVCSARPEELVRAHSLPARVQSTDASDGKQFYFFSPARFVGNSTLNKRSRTIDGTDKKESWHVEGRRRPIGGSAAGGYVTKLSYRVTIGPKTIEKPGWIMAEYTFKDTGAGDTVLCKIYKSPRGPGRSTSSSSSCTSSAKSGCKRKAVDDLEEASSSRRPRQTNQCEVDDTVLFLLAGDLEHDRMMSVENTTIEAAPEIGETRNVEGSQPESQVQVEELPRMMMAEEDGDGMTVLVPDGGDPEANSMELLFGDSKPQDLDELFLHAPSCQPDPQVEQLQSTTMAEEDCDGMTLLVPDGGDPEAYFMGILFGNSKPQDNPSWSHAGRGNLGSVPCT